MCSQCLIFLVGMVAAVALVVVSVAQPVGSESAVRSTIGAKENDAREWGETDASAGGAAVGTMVFEFTTPGIGRIAEAAGADFVLFDQEHTPWGLETLAAAMAVMRFTRPVPLVRVPTLQSHLVSRLLDVGALGVMVPLVETQEQAARIVEAARYPPVGRRGVSGGLAHDDYRGEDVASAMRQANAETLLIAQIETAQGVECGREIAAVEGIDVLWMGQMDLSTSLGVAGQYRIRRIWRLWRRLSWRPRGPERPRAFWRSVTMKG